MTCIGLAAATPLSMYHSSWKNSRLRAKCRKRDLHIPGERAKLEFKINLIKRGKNTITFSDLCHKFLPAGYVELASREGILFRSQLSVEFI